MAEWGKYLKNAVANVEQQLDKVLLENQNQTQYSRASPAPSSQRPSRPDLQERLRRAATASKGHKPDSKASTPQSEDNRTENVLAEDVGVADSRAEAEGAQERPEGVIGLTDKSEKESAREANISTASDVGHSAKSIDDAESKDLPDIVTTQELVLAPDLGMLLNQARKIALTYQGDDTLEFVDALEIFKKDYDNYDANVKERIMSMNSKIAYLSQERAARTDGSEHRVALLLEEGQRLSQQELKLGLIIKRLRAERATALSKETMVQTKDKELAVLRAEKTAIMNQLKEQEALAEHFRGLAESASVGDLSLSGPLSSDVKVDGNDQHQNTYAYLHRRLEAAESNHEVAKRTWHDLESSLLTRIAELELNAEARATSAAHIQNNMKELQDSARETRNQMISLQDELDASQERWHAAEKQYQSEIEHLQQQLEREQAGTTREVSRPSYEKEPTEITDRVEVPSVYSSPRSRAQTEDFISPAVVIDTSHSELVQEPDGVESSMEPFENNEFQNATGFLNGSEGPVGPAGPFGSLADDFDSEHRPNLSRDDSRDLFEDSFSFMAPSASRRESSIVGSEAVNGSQLHIVKKLTLTVRRLENELSTVRKACELSDLQRDEAQSEVVRLVDAQDNLAALQLKYVELENANNELSAQLKHLQSIGVDKDERIEELEADVRDLKDMYREQVEALITEIEDLKTQTPK